MLKEESLQDLYELMMRREVDPILEADRFDLSESERKQLIQAAMEAESELDFVEMPAEPMHERVPRRRLF